MQQILLEPDHILLTEEYAYKSKVSGVRETNLETSPVGIILVTIPYSNYRRYSDDILRNRLKTTSRFRSLVSQEKLNFLLGLISGRFPRQTRSLNNFNTMMRSLTAPIGYLRCNQYGQSNLDKLPGLNWERDLLSMTVKLGATEWAQLNSQQKRFDLQLKQTYQPNEPQGNPLEVRVHIVDEDSEADESNNFVKELRKQADIKRSLIMKFRVILSLPKHMGELYPRDLPQISSMRLKWPIATPHRLAKLRVGSTLYPPIIYNPEREFIEWNNVPLKFAEGNARYLDIYHTDEISLEIGEPTEIYEKLEMCGNVSLELNGLLSGLDLDHLTYEDQSHGNTLITRRTVLRNEFVLDLEEGLKDKYYSPRQHLHFPGVVLNEMRIADVIMLLEDKGFEIKVKDEPSPRKPEEHENRNNKDKIYIIKAKRSEGARDIEISILIQGMSAETTREREVVGQAKYTTALPVGATSIYIQGKLQGDSKRIVNVINEIQKQLKEQFRHVGTAE